MLQVINRARAGGQLGRDSGRERPRLSELKIGIRLASLKLGVRKGLAVAKQLGARSVEIDARGEIRPEALTQSGLRELRRLIEEHGLGVSAVGFATRRGYDVADDLERRVAATEAAMKLAADLRACVVVNQVGRVPAESSGPGWDQLVQSLGDLSHYGQHVGAILAAQTGTESGADLARLLAALPPQGIGVDLDPGNLIINGFSAIEAVAALGPSIVHVHARDGVRDLARGRGLEVPLSRGVADFPALLGALEEHRYRGYFTIARDDAADAISEIGDAVQYLKSL